MNYKEKIEAAVIKHKDRLAPCYTGLMPVDGFYVAQSADCKVCALGAYALEHKVPAIDGDVQAIAADLDIGIKDAMDIARGFDSAKSKDANDFWLFGHSLRKHSTVELW